MCIYFFVNNILFLLDNSIINNSCNFINVNFLFLPVYEKYSDSFSSIYKSSQISYQVIKLKDPPESNCVSFNIYF